MMSEPRHTALSGFTVRAGVHFSVTTGFDCGAGRCCASDYNAAKRHARTCRVPDGAGAPQSCSLLYNLMLAARRGDRDWVECCRSEVTRQKTNESDQAAVSHWSVLDDKCRTKQWKYGIRFRPRKRLVRFSISWPCVWPAAHGLLEQDLLALRLPCEWCSRMRLRPQPRLLRRFASRSDRVPAGPCLRPNRPGSASCSLCPHVSAMKSSLRLPLQPRRDRRCEAAHS